MELLHVYDFRVGEWLNVAAVVGTAYYLRLVPPTSPDLRPRKAQRQLHRALQHSLAVELHRL